MSSVNPPYQQTGIIDQALQELRRMIRRYVSLRGVILAGIWSILFFWFAGFVDYLPVWFGANDSPRIVRLLLLVGLVAVAIFLLARFTIGPLLVRWSDRSLALLLERKFPTLDNTLITLIENRDLSQSRREIALSRDWEMASDASLQQSVATQAQRRVSQIDVYDVLRWEPLRWLSAIFAGLLVTSLLAFVVMPQWSSLWSKRLFLLSDQAWPRKTSLQVDALQLPIANFTGQVDRNFYRSNFIDGVASMPTGQNARLLASANLNSKLVPRFCTLFYYDEEGQNGRANLRRLPIDRRKNLQPFMLEGPPLDSINRDLNLTITGGDVRLSKLKIHAVPTIEFRKIELAITYPEYLKRRSTSTYFDGVQEYRNGMRLPEGCEIKIIATANQSIQRCEYRITQVESQASEKTAEATANSVGELKLNSDKIELPLGSLRENLLVEFRPWSSTGHCSSQIKQYVIAVVKDQLPTADLSLQGIGSSITPLAKIPLRATVQDDHDIQSVQTKMFITDQMPIDRQLDYKNVPEINSDLDLRELRDRDGVAVNPGDVLTLIATADDFYDLTDMSRVGQSSPVALSVVTVDQLLVILDRRELDLRNRMEQVLIELDQLTALLSKSQTEQSIAQQNVDEDGATPMILVRTQEAKIQAEQSQGELAGIANQIGMIVDELNNNRIDSVDRQSRLQDKVRSPINELLGSEVKTLVADLQKLENDLRDNSYEKKQLDDAIDLNIELIIKLKDILKNMLDIQDFNEVVDMLRSMIEKQEQLLEKTKEEQKRRALDFFK